MLVTGSRCCGCAGSHGPGVACADRHGATSSVGQCQAFVLEGLKLELFVSRLMIVIINDCIQSNNDNN